MEEPAVVQIDRDTHLLDCVEVFVAAFAVEPWNESWPGAVARARLTEILQTPGSLGLAAYAGKDCLGFVIGYVETFHPVDRFQLAEMAVRPQRQRSGIGRSLVRQLLDRLAADGVGEVYLITSRGEAPEAFWLDRSFVRSNGRTVMVHRGV